MKNKTIQYLVNAFSAVSLFSSSLLAQEAAQTDLDLEEVTLTGRKAEKNEYTSLNSISFQDIQLKQPDDISALFDNSLSVHVNGGKAQGQQIFINNLESTLANVTINGAVQGNLNHHRSSLLIEPELMKSVEVHAGAGTALDGAGALAGALRLETVNAFDLLNEGEQFGGLSKVTGYDNGNGFKFSQSAYGEFAEGWGVLVSGSYMDRDDFEDGDGDTIEESPYARTSALAKLTGKIDESQTVEFSYEHFEEEFDSYYRVNINAADFGFWTGSLVPVTSERNTGTISYDLNPEDQEWLDIESTFYYTKQEYENNGNLSKSEEYEAAEIESVGLDIRNTSGFDLFSVTYGVDYREDDINSEYREVGYVESGDEEVEVFGSYAQVFAPISEFVEVSFGARYDDYNYDDNFSKNFSSDEVSPNANVTLKPIEDLQITGGYAEAYRGVTRREAFLTGSEVPEVANGETSKTWKLEFDYDNGFIFAAGAVFEQEIEDYLNATNSNPLNQDIENDGYELKIGARRNGFYGSLGVSYADPDYDDYVSDYNEPIGLVVAGRRWVSDFGYVATHTDGKFFWRAGWLVEYREEVDSVSHPTDPIDASVAQKDSYVVHNFNFRFVPPTFEALTLTLNIDNVFDHNYRDHSIYQLRGLNSPGRVIRLGASYQF